MLVSKSYSLIRKLLVQNIRSMDYLISLRPLSAISYNNLDQNQRDCSFQPILRIKSYNHQTRNISVDGIIKWQEQTYANIANSSPVQSMQDGLLYVHDLTGMPWWATIITSTILIRSCMTLPLSVYQNYILAKVEIIGIELKGMVEELKKETAVAKKEFNLSDKDAMILYKSSINKLWQNLIVRDNCHPLKASLIIWFQIPVWVCTSFALRNLVYTPHKDPAALVTLMELSTGGVGWIPNLTVPDQSWIIPVAFGLVNLSIIEIQRMSRLRQPSKVYDVFTNVFRVFSVVMVPVAANVPSCICLYWFTSSCVGLAHNLFLLSPSVRRTLKIPLAPSEIEDPYKHIKEQMQLQLKKIVPKALKQS